MNASPPRRAGSKAAIESDVNWASIDTEVEFSGKKIILPGDPEEMDLGDAIETLERVKEQAAQKFDVDELVAGAPWDSLVAIYRACQNIYGVVTSHSIKTWFGDINPDFVTINTGPGAEDKIQVPMGQMRVPGFKEPFMIGFDPRGRGARISGTVNKKDQARLLEIANEARRVIRENSVYRGKSIVLNVDDDGNLMLGTQPGFLELSKVSEADMIHPVDVEKMIQTNMFSPLKNTEACRRHHIPLKRGILLEGRYGTGKSLTARVTAKVANDNGWTFIMLNRSQGLKSAIDFARQYQPCVIFAEDIDRAADRTNESVNDLVNLIDGVNSKDMELLTVLTTNFLENIDQSLLRPGRFDAVISLSPPDAPTVGRLIRAYARELIGEGVDLDKTNELLAGQVPATIREVVERAKLSMLMDDRTHLTSDDLYVSAYGMTRHMELLKPKEKSQTPADMLFQGMKAAVAEVTGLEVDASIQETLDGLVGLTHSYGRSSKELTTMAINAAKAGISKGDEVLAEVKKAAPRARA